MTNASLMKGKIFAICSVAPVSVNTSVSGNVDNNRRCPSRYCKRVYNNGTVSVNIDSNGSHVSRYCQG